MDMTIPKFIPPTVLERIEAHIAANPGIMTRELVEQLDVTFGSANMAIHRLQATGKINRMNLLNERRAKWQAGPAADFDPDHPSPGIGQPKQRIVKTWERPRLAPDPLLWAMYGAQP